MWLLTVNITATWIGLYFKYSHTVRPAHIEINSGKAKAYCALLLRITEESAIARGIGQGNGCIVRESYYHLA